MKEARKNDEVISLASSQILRWIDELNGVVDADERAREIRASIRDLRKEPPSREVRRAMDKLYADLDALQFKPDYMCLVIDRDKDYRQACRGFSINGITYKRLLGTPNGVKNSTIVFVSERLHGELSRRIENDRDPSKELVPAKLEAYKGLACSASIPVSFPNGILVVDDAETEFLSDVIYLSNQDSEEPVMELKKSYPIKLDASDGFGLMLPSLASRWSEELGLEYRSGGMNTRFSFEKGMLVAFDFIDFAKNVAGKYIVKDAWGFEVDVRNVEAIFTTSMVKLWDSYGSCDEYVKKSLHNGYTFGITKCCPAQLEDERTLNYQFIQSYNLDDDDIDELIEPTMQEIRDVLGGDWRKTVLFLRGVDLTDRNVLNGSADIAKAIMIDHDMLNDPYIQNTVYHLIKNRINEAKIGVLNIHGNYSIICGDPYLLCQNIFGMEKTGLLRPGEIYSKYWSDYGSDKLACFRAPMTCHNNIRAVHPASNEETSHWFQYMPTMTVFNAFDTATMALNGADFDSDTVMLTDNPVLVRKMVPGPAIMCEQRKAAKIVPTEQDLVESNIRSFGTEIGQITNRITSMYEVQAAFDKASEEYKVLDYRIKCGQLLQQDSIDKAKGVVSKPMDKRWYDRHAVNAMEDGEQKSLYKKIVAMRKPYFMTYIYPALARQYKTHIKNTSSSCIREFRLTIDQLLDTPYADLTDRQKEFLYYYEKNMPIGNNPCVMNKICHKFEEAFDKAVSRKSNNGSFDYSIMKSGSPYTKSQYYEINALYNEYNKSLNSYSVITSYERIDKEDSLASLRMLNEEFNTACHHICTNDLSLCDILLDICYSKEATKRFAWGLCGETIITNLLLNNDNKISFPTQDENGDVAFHGKRFSVNTLQIGDIDEYSFR